MKGGCLRTAPIVLILLVISVTVQICRSAVEVDDDVSEERSGARDGVGNFDDGCGVAVNLGMKNNVIIQSPNFTNGVYEDNLSCKFHIYGTAACIPNLVCDVISIRLSSNCTKENLRISDGVGGEVVFCGKHTRPTEVIQASKGYRDLFIHFKTGRTKELGSSKGLTGVRCNVKCGEPGKITGTTLALIGKPRKVIQNCTCGVQRKSGRIVGGEDVALNEFPWLAALVSPNTRKPFCGATLINDRFVLTAAHCFFYGGRTDPADVQVLFRARVLDFKLMQDIGPNAFEAPLGVNGSIRGPGWDLARVNDTEEKSVRIDVTRIIRHPLFAATFDYDACLLELKQPVKFQLPDSLTPVCLPPLGIVSNKYTGEFAIVAGWGKGHELAAANNRMLQKLTIPILNLIKCNITIPYALTRRMICAGYMEGKRDACTGDSGGPLMLNVNNMYKQIGIVSWGEGCARKNRPGLYARVTEFNQWISYESSEADAKWCKG